MITVELNNNTYFLPQSWDEVKHRQFEQLEALRNDKSVDKNDIPIKRVAILMNMTSEMVEAVPVEVIHSIYPHVKFIESVPEYSAKKHVVVNGVTYYADSLKTAGDFAVYHKISNAFEGQEYLQSIYFLALLLKKQVISTPKPAEKNWLKRLFSKKTAEIQAEIELEPVKNDMDFIEERANLFKNTLSVIDVLSIAAFFLNNHKLSMSVTRNYSQLQRINQQLTLNQLNLGATCIENTDGKLIFTIWNKMFSITLKFYKWALMKSLIYSNTGKK